MTEHVRTEKAGKYKVIHTWLVKDSQGTVTGEKVSAEAYVTVVEKKKEEPLPVTKPTDRSTTNPTSHSITSELAGKTTNSVGTNTKKLPQTYEESGLSGLLMGAMMINLSGLFLVLQKKRRGTSK